MSDKDGKGNRKKYKHGSAHAAQVHVARHGINGYLVDLDTHIRATLVECCVGRDWDDAERDCSAGLVITRNKTRTFRVP